MKILGIDPGLQKTGWGIIESEGNRLTFLACGMVKTQAALPLYARLAALDEAERRGAAVDAGHGGDRGNLYEQ